MFQIPFLILFQIMISMKTLFLEMSIDRNLYYVYIHKSLGSMIEGNQSTIFHIIVSINGGMITF